MNLKFGMIAEDQSDVDVVKHLITKVLPDKAFSLKRYIGHGCGRIHGKCRQWAESLKSQQCNVLIVLHDLDDGDCQLLKSTLEEALLPSPIRYHVIVIPVREIEAWLLSDAVAVKKAMRLRQPFKEFANPEAIQRPKEKLEEIVYLRSGRTIRYVNAVHNERIAKELRLPAIRRCKSFIPLEDFLLSLPANKRN
jgi:hypothetical protein